MEKIIVTGCSGFIGMHLCESLLSDDFEILGVDNMNPFYSVNLKEMRLEKLKKFKNFTFKKADISDLTSINTIFTNFKPEKVINLAAQAGVRHSLKYPQDYIRSNVLGFVNILESSVKNNVNGLIYASSSSIYGANEKLPFAIEDLSDNAISVYGVTKKSNELLANAYNYLYQLKTTGLRFFTVYGPWGRPDMAMFIFTENIKKRKPITLFNNGNMQRDFTYIDDVIKGIRATMEKNYDNEKFNIGNNKIVEIKRVVELIESNLNLKAIIKNKSMQLGDIKSTLSDISYTQKKIDYYPSTSIEEGVKKFINWYLKFPI